MGMSIGFGAGSIEYGLGMMAQSLSSNRHSSPFTQFYGNNPVTFPYSKNIGHAGVDFGSNGNTYYYPGYDLALAFGQNKDFYGSLEAVQEYMQMYCQVLSTVVEGLQLGGPKFDCKSHRLLDVADDTICVAT